MALRLLDANVLIQAKNTYYSFDLVPAFWEWIDQQPSFGAIASTDLVYKELRAGSDELATWAKDRRHSLFRFESSSPVVAACIDSLHTWAATEGYRAHTMEIFMGSADPSLVAVAAELDAVVVTLEESAGHSRKKIKIPDVCNFLGVAYENTFEMMRSLGARFA